MVFNVQKTKNEFKTTLDDQKCSVFWPGWKKLVWAPKIPARCRRIVLHQDEVRASFKNIIKK